MLERDKKSKLGLPTTNLFVCKILFVFLSNEKNYLSFHLKLIFKIYKKKLFELKNDIIVFHAQHNHNYVSQGKNRHLPITFPQKLISSSMFHTSLDKIHFKILTHNSSLSISLLIFQLY